jgi:orotidine-5'-phosphate decarboxylase
VRTSNPSAGDLQDLEVVRPDGQGTAPVYLRVAALLAELSQGLAGPSGYTPIGAVVGATYPRQAVLVREALPQSWFLVPGYGAQGATAADVAASFDAHGLGAVVNSSRGIIFAHTQAWARDSGMGWQEAAAEATRQMRQDLNQAIAARGTPRG